MTANTLTITGNLTADPELRFTPSGAAVANITVAHTPRKFNRDTEEWEDGETTFVRGSIWRGYAENVAESLSKGDPVIVTGALRQRSYETKDGDERTVLELELEDVAVPLQFATVEVTRVKGGKGKAANRPARKAKDEDADEAPRKARTRKARPKVEDDEDDDEF